MNTIIGNIDLSPTLSRDQEFRRFVGAQQTYYDLDHMEVNDFFQRLCEGEDMFTRLLEAPNLDLKILSGGMNNLLEMLGDHAQIIRQSKESLRDVVLPRNWYHDALLEINSFNLSQIVYLENSGNKMPDSLKEANFQAERGMVYLKGAIGKPEFSATAMEHFHSARETLSQKGVHEPRLSYCLGLCSFYFLFNYETAITLFKEAILHLELERKHQMIARCYYELGKLYHLTEKEEESLQCFQKAVAHDQEFMEAKFQLLRMLVLTRGGTAEINTLLDELEEYNPCYVLKIVSEKLLRESHVIITWLVNISARHTKRLTAKIKELRRKYADAVERQYYEETFRLLEEAVQSHRYFAILLARTEAEKLHQQARFDQQYSLETIAELKATYDHYKELTWGDSLLLKELSQYISSLEERVNEGFLLTDEDYDPTELKEESDRKARTLDYLNKKYGITLQVNNKASLSEEIKKALLAKKADKIKVLRSMEDGKEANNASFIILLSGVGAAIYFIYVNWNWYNFSSFKNQGFLNYILYFMIKTVGVVVVFAVAAFLFIWALSTVWNLILDGLIRMYAHFYNKNTTAPKVEVPDEAEG